MRLRHISRKKAKRLVTPAGTIIASRLGDEFEASEADGAWLLTLRARNCNCGGQIRPNGNGLPVYEAVTSEA